MKPSKHPAPRPLKELPGFDDAMAEARKDRNSADSVFVLAPGLGDTVLPGVRAVDQWMLVELGMILFAERSRWPDLRLVPPPKPEAANDG
jgi:hypothetical protein